MQRWEESSEDEDVVLQRMLVDPKRVLSKGDLPGLYKARPSAPLLTPSMSQSPRAGHAEASRPKQHKALPGRLRKKLARAAADQQGVPKPKKFRASDFKKGKKAQNPAKS